MKEYIACCGLDCEKCDARIATVNNDDQLRIKTAELWSQLNNAEITPEMINCTGCRLPGAKTPFCDYICPIRQCAREKNYATCQDCPDMDGCPVLATITANAPEALANLKNTK